LSPRRFRRALRLSCAKPALALDHPVLCENFAEVGAVVRKYSIAPAFRVVGLIGELDPPVAPKMTTFMKR
jgi:hypothetical protein